MSGLSEYLTAKNTIEDPRMQKNGNLLRLIEQAHSTQASLANILANIGNALTDDAALDTPLLTAGDVTEAKAEVAKLKTGGTLVGGQDVLGTDTIASMIDGITGA